MEHPRTHPARPDQGRAETDSDVLDVALQLRNMLSNEEIWYVLQTWKKQIITDYENFLCEGMWDDDEKEADKEDLSGGVIQSNLLLRNDPGGDTSSDGEGSELSGCVCNYSHDCDYCR